MTKTQRVSNSILKRIEKKEKAVQTYIDSSDFEKLSELAKKDDRSISLYLRRLIGEHVRRGEL